MKNKHLKILLSAPRGFCAGVERAIEIVEKSIKKFGAPVYVRHEICLLYTSPSPRDVEESRMPSSA